MPLVAEARKSENEVWRLVDVTQHVAPKRSLAGMEFRCPGCKTSMHLKAGVFVMAHFAHAPGSQDCAQAGESMEHIHAKIQLAETLAKQAEYDGATIHKEFWLPEVQRRADLLVVFPDGLREVHEIQLAAITPNELEQRTHDYEQAGIGSVGWWFGANAGTANNKAWAKQRIGGYGTLEFYESTSVRLQG